MTRITEEEPQPLGMCMFPVDDRWALEWGELEEDQETASLLREDAANWHPKKFGGPDEDLLDRYKRLSEARPSVN